MNSTEIIKTVIPDASQELCGYILWERTSYPFKLCAKTLYKAASRFKRACDNKINLCDLCDNKAIDGGYTCEKCERALAKIRA